MKYETFNNLQFKPLLAKSFHSNNIDWTKTGGEKYPWFQRVSLVLFCRLEKPPTVISKVEDLTRWLL